MLFDNEFQQEFYINMSVSLLILAFLIGYICVIARHTYRNKDQLRMPKFIKNVSKMYPDVFLVRIEGQQYFYLAFIVRRFLFSSFIMVTEVHVLI